MENLLRVIFVVFTVGIILNGSSMNDSCFNPPVVKKNSKSYSRLLPDYNLSWGHFKKVVIENDLEQLKGFTTSNITDHEGLLFLLNEVFVLRKLDETEFKDLEELDEDGQIYFIFYAEEIGEDEFGYEYASAVKLFFIKNEQGLFLDKYSAAG